MPFTLKGLVQDEALQKVLISENALDETSYETKITQVTSGASNIAR